MIATTIEQSRHLLELGLDTKTADCHYKDIGNVGEHYKLEVGGLIGNNDIPAWSLSALLEVMPKDMTCGVVFKPRYKQPSGSEVIKEWWAYCVFRDIVHYNESDNDQLTAAYNLVCYLLKQGLIKK